MSSTTRAAAVDLKNCLMTNHEEKRMLETPKTPSGTVCHPCCSAHTALLLQALSSKGSIPSWARDVWHTAPPSTPPPSEKRWPLSWRARHLPHDVDHMQRPPTIASVGDLLIGPLSSSPLNSFMNRRRTYPRTKQGLATFSNCSSITIHPGHGVVQLKVADVVVKVEVFSGLTFWLLGYLKGPPNRPMVTLPPCPPKSLTRGRRLVLYQFIS